MTLQVCGSKRSTQVASYVVKEAVGNGCMHQVRDQSPEDVKEQVRTVTCSPYTCGPVPF